MNRLEQVVFFVLGVIMLGLMYWATASAYWWTGGCDCG